jgi:hypothetical protein
MIIFVLKIAESRPAVARKKKHFCGYRRNEYSVANRRAEFNI